MIKISEDSGIKKFLKRETLEEILARCVAEEGMTMNTLVKSKAVKGYVSSRGYELPKHPSTITKHVLKYYEIKKSETIGELNNLKKQNIKFSITRR